MYRIAVASAFLLAALGLQFLSFLLTAKGLGPVEFGQLSAILAFALPASELVGFGASERFLQRVSRRPRLFPYALANSVATIAATAPIIAIPLIILCSTVVVPDVSLTTISLLVITETSVQRFSMHVELVSIAKGAFFLINVQRLFAGVARCGLAFIFFFVMHKSELQLYSYAYFATMSFVAVVLQFNSIIRFGRPRFHPHARSFMIGPSFALLQFARSVAQSADRMVLSLVLNYDQIGIYNAGARILAAALVPIGYVQRQYYPKFFQVGMLGIEPTVSFAWAILPKIFMVSAAGSMVGATGALFLPHLLGPRYEASAVIGAIVSWTAVAMALQHLAGDILTGVGDQPTRAAAAFAVIPLTCVIIFAGAWYYGIVGAAIASVGAQVVTAGVMWIVVALRRRKWSPRPR
jgi:O-antigen/teichoic acid export membrane protein